MVHFLWYSNRYPRKPEVPAIAANVAEVVERHVPKTIFARTQIKRPADDLGANRSRLYISFGARTSGYLDLQRVIRYDSICRSATKSGY